MHPWAGVTDVRDSLRPDATSLHAAWKFGTYLISIHPASGVLSLCLYGVCFSSRMQGICRECVFVPPSQPAARAQSRLERCVFVSTHRDASAVLMSTHRGGICFATLAPSASCSITPVGILIWTDSS